MGSQSSDPNLHLASNGYAQEMAQLRLSQRDSSVESKSTNENRAQKGKRQSKKKSLNRQQIPMLNNLVNIYDPASTHRVDLNDYNKQMYYKSGAQTTQHAK